MVDRTFRPEEQMPAFLRWLRGRKDEQRFQQWMEWWRARQQYANPTVAPSYPATPQAAAVAPVAAPVAASPPPAAAPVPAYQMGYVAPAPNVAPQAAPQSAPMTFAPQSSAPAQPYNPNPYAATIGDRQAAYDAFNRVRNGGDGGFAWDALRTSHPAQDELYLQNADASMAFDNWFRSNAGDFYNRYVADSAQTGGGDQQYTDWLYKNDMGAEFLRRPGANRGYFEGLYNPAARVII